MIYPRTTPDHGHRTLQVGPGSRSLHRDVQVSRSPGMGESDHYERHRPEDTALYRLVQDQAETFFAQVEAETAHGLPDYVKTEFNAFLDCGILANGFLRLQCGDCHHEKIVAFS